ncbi:MAG: hypothetical protein EWV49_00415 [Microcystis aeruginosa Ma_QC_Ch_20071001_S25]|nr:MAG: hypothetical protein EWV49_00415 [Microcystis aeruginosa Ma_QC_Ch_20071001_S25]
MPEGFLQCIDSEQNYIPTYLGSAEKVFRWGLGVGGWGEGGWGMGFTDFQVVNYLIFREKVPEFSP